MTHTRRLESTTLVAIAILAVAWRLAVGPFSGSANAWSLPWIQVNYLELATNIASGRGYWLALDQNAIAQQAASTELLPIDALPHDFAHQYRPIQYFLPGYAYVIALPVALAGSHDWSVAQSFNAFVDGIVGPVLVYALISRGGGGHLAAYIGAVFYAASPLVARMVAQVIPDSLSPIFSLLPVACVVTMRCRGRFGLAAAVAGVSIGIAGAFRGEFIALLPLVATLVALGAGGGWRRRLTLASLVGAGWLLGTLPLTVFWNQVYAQPTLSRPGLGIRVWEGIGTYANPWNIRDSDEAAGALLDQNGFAYGTPEGDAFLLSDAIGHFRESPYFLLRSVVVRGRDVVRYGLEGWSDLWPAANSIRAMVAVVVAGLAVVGAAAVARRSPFLFGAFACLWLSRVVPFSVMEVQPRDLIPLHVVYSCLAACGLAAVAIAIRDLGLRRRHLRASFRVGRGPAIG
jgi:hypothetical protein